MNHSRASSGASASAAMMCAGERLHRLGDVVGNLRPVPPGHAARWCWRCCLAGGCFVRCSSPGSMISYAESTRARLGQASSMAGMMQQLSLSTGVAIGGYLLEAAGWLWQRPDTVAQFLRRVRGGGAGVSQFGVDDVEAAARRRRGMAGRAQPGGEIAEPETGAGAGDVSGLNPASGAMRRNKLLYD